MKLRWKRYHFKDSVKSKLQIQTLKNARMGKINLRPGLGI